jgi:hypothetical protein
MLAGLPSATNELVKKYSEAQQWNGMECIIVTNPNFLSTG